MDDVVAFGVQRTTQASEEATDRSIAGEEGDLRRRRQPGNEVGADREIAFSDQRETVLVVLPVRLAEHQDQVKDLEPSPRVPPIGRRGSALAIEHGPSSGVEAWSRVVRLCLPPCRNEALRAHPMTPSDGVPPRTSAGTCR